MKFWQLEIFCNWIGKIWTVLYSLNIIDWQIEQATRTNQTDINIYLNIEWKKSHFSERSSPSGTVSECLLIHKMLFLQFGSISKRQLFTLFLPNFLPNILPNNPTIFYLHKTHYIIQSMNAFADLTILINQPF